VRIAAGAGVREVLATACDLRNATPYLFRVCAKDWLSNHVLVKEVFGPLGLIVTVETIEEMLAVAKSFVGQLTATLHLDEADTPLARRLLPILDRKAGRVLANGYPTGVECLRRHGARRPVPRIHQLRRHICRGPLDPKVPEAGRLPEHSGGAAMRGPQIELATDCAIARQWRIHNQLRITASCTEWLSV
jgi:hypothetical protein